VEPLLVFLEPSNETVSVLLERKEPINLIIQGEKMSLGKSGWQVVSEAFFDI
jgi:hypothetical protein